MGNIIDNQSFSTVQDIGFQRLLKAMVPNYVMPSRRHFSEHVIPEIYGNI
jgi:hypothetical protein